MAVTRVQHVTQAASEGLSAKFCDLCDPHDLTSIRASKRTISKLTAKSRASNKALRQLRNQDRRVLASSSTDDDAFLMSFIPLKTEPSLYRMRRSFSVSQLGSPAMSADFHMGCNSPRKTGHGVTKKLLRLCMGSSANKYTPYQCTETKEISYIPSSGHVHGHGRHQGVGFRMSLCRRSLQIGNLCSSDSLCH